MEGASVAEVDSKRVPPLKESVDAERIFSQEDLSRFDGEQDPNIYISFLGTVYDVTDKPEMYGRSPPGPYHIFAGRECARSLATMSMEPVDVGRTDVEDLTDLCKRISAVMSPDEVREAVSKAMRDWHERFAQSYPRVGEMRPWLRGSGSSMAPPKPLCGLRGLAKPSDDYDADAMGGAAEPPGPLELISEKPRAYLQRHFLSPLECRRLVAMTKRRARAGQFSKKIRAPLEVEDPQWSVGERALLKRIEERLAELTGGPVHADETALVGTLTPGGGEEGISEHLGLHVDTNAAEWRFCTAIVYLSSVLAGGETVFPAALALGDTLPSEETERASEAAGRLLDLGVLHTDKVLQVQFAEGKAEAEALLDAAASGVGLKVAPEEGLVCIFWTRLSDGEIDRHSWHGGAPVPRGGNWKWTMQKFKEVPLSARRDSAVLADFVRSTRRAR